MLCTITVLLFIHVPLNLRFGDILSIFTNSSHPQKSYFQITRKPCFHSIGQHCNCCKPKTPNLCIILYVCIKLCLWNSYVSLCRVVFVWLTIQWYEVIFPAITTIYNNIVFTDFQITNENKNCVRNSTITKLRTQYYYNTTANYMIRCYDWH